MSRPLYQHPTSFRTPSQAILTVQVRQDRRVLEPAIWGFKPFWLPDRRMPPPINARAETLLERPLWKGALRSGRCLIPADGYFEWRTLPGSRVKQPSFIHPCQAGPFAFAGLWAEDADGNPTAAIVTVSAKDHPLMEPIHDRLPVILDRAGEALWLDPTIRRPELVLPLLRPYPSEAMVVREVPRLVNDVRNEGTDLIAPLVPDDARPAHELAPALPT